MLENVARNDRSKRQNFGNVAFWGSINLIWAQETQKLDGWASGDGEGGRVVIFAKKRSAK